MQTEVSTDYTTSIFLRNVSAKCLSFDLSFLKISKGVIYKEFSSLYLVGNIIFHQLTSGNCYLLFLFKQITVSNQFYSRHKEEREVSLL